MIEHYRMDPNLLRGKKVLDIGCGRNKLPGSTGMDAYTFPGVDIVHDLNEPLPLSDGQFDIVHANQVLEHIPNLIGLIGEIHRVLRAGGYLIAHVPYFRSSWAHVDPTHIRSFTINSLDYFVKGTFFFEQYRFNDVAFASREVFLDSDYPSTFWRRYFSSRARRLEYKHENSWLSFVYPFEQITFVLRKQD